MKIKAEKINQLTGHQGAIYALAEGTPENKFFSGGSDRVIVQWDMTTWQPGEVVARTPSVIYSILCLPGKNLLLIGQGEGGIHVLDVESGKEIRLLKFHNSSVFVLKADKEKNILLSAAGDGTLAVTSLENLTLIKLIRLTSHKLRSIDIHENIAAVSSGDGRVFIISLLNYEVIDDWLAHQQGFSANVAKFHATQPWLITGGRDAHINIYDCSNEWKPVQKIPAHNYAVYDVVFNHEKTLAASASRDKTIKLWNAKDFSFLLRIDKEHFDGHLNSVNKLLWTGYNDYLISAGDDRSIIVWKIISG